MRKYKPIFKISFPDVQPIYVWTRDIWGGLTNIIDESYKHKDGIITPITYWQFIKEWLKIDCER